MSNNNNEKLILLAFFAIVLIVVSIILLFTKSANFIDINTDDQNQMVVKASFYDTDTIKYENNVYLVKGSLGLDFQIEDDNVTFYKNYNFKVNQVIIGDESPGFLLRILKVNNFKDGKLTLVTEKVDLDKVFQIIETKQTFTLPQIYQAYGISAQGSTNFSIPINSTKNLEFGNVTFTGALVITPIVNIELNGGLTGVSYFKLEMNSFAQFNLNTNIYVAGKYSKDYENQIYPPQGARNVGWTIPICTGVWVTLNPSLALTLDLAADATFQYNLLFSAFTTYPYKVGFEYIKGQSIRKIGSSGTWSRSLTPKYMKGNANFSLVPGIKFSLNCLLWGSIGPLIGLKLYLRYINNTYLCQTLTDEQRLSSMMLDSSGILVPAKSILNNLDLATSICSNQTKKVGVNIFTGGSVFSKSFYFDIYSYEWNV